MTLSNGMMHSVSFADPTILAREALVEGKDFRLDEETLYVGIGSHVSQRARDLARIGMAVYVADRLSRRDRRSADRGPYRDISLAIEAHEPDFWTSEPVRSLVVGIAELLSDDSWEIRFLPPSRLPRPRQRTFEFHAMDPPRVCLYSGGLDSAAGLATRLRDLQDPILAVTAWHQDEQRGRILGQLDCLRRRYDRTVHSVMPKVRLIDPPEIQQQEFSQRCRSFMFASIGGAVACGTGASTVEVYESGVGAVNLPLMTGMLVGGRSSRSCHPAFLRQMGELVSLVAERTVTFELPFRHFTKAEVTRTLVEDSLEALAADTVSCVHFPLRYPQCGVCAACIARRQAIITAGISEPAARYDYDLFGGPQLAQNVQAGKLDFLIATLMQVELLRGLTHGRPLPDLVRRQLYGTEIIRGDESPRPWVDVLIRYRDEWLDLIARARSLAALS